MGTRVHHTSHNTLLSAQSSAETLSNNGARQQEKPIESEEEKTLENKNDEPRAEQLAKPTANTVGPPPNGGLRAWLIVLGGFMLFFNTWGILVSSYQSHVMERVRVVSSHVVGN